MFSKKYLPPRLRKVLYVALALFALSILLQSRSLSDWWKLRNYTPSDAVASLAEDTTMTRFAKHLFYVNHAEIADKKAFAKVCPSGEEKTIVLGCYKSGNNGIHILSVSDKRLDGVEEVTAAHEMLHAAYERLKEGDRQRLDDFLEKYYRNNLRDQRIKDVLKGYETSEPGQQFNEMHSIFGTEVSDLPAELEAYYKAYFSDRSKVVGFAQRYQSEFTRRQEAIKKDDAQLSAWKQQITANEAQLQMQQTELSRQQAQMQRTRASGNTDAYNALVPIYNTKVDAYNSLLEATRMLIKKYNQLVEERNAIAVETTRLQEALSGSLSPIQE